MNYYDILKKYEKRKCSLGFPDGFAWLQIDPDGYSTLETVGPNCIIVIHGNGSRTICPYTILVTDIK